MGTGRKETDERPNIASAKRCERESPRSIRSPLRHYVICQEKKLKPS
jgi:hypothetical protein